MSVQVTEVREPSELRALHAAILAPSFPPDELESPDDMAEGLASGALVAMAASSADEPVALAVGAWDPTTSVLLLSYLAVGSGGRGGGVGGTLLAAALTAWQADLDPLVVLAEIEDPALHTGSPEHGDPAARERFYLRRGARRLPLAYVQPALAPGLARVPGMLLLALAVRGSVVAPDDAWHLPAAPVRDFLLGYYTRSEGRVPDDDQVLTMLAPLTGTATLVVRP
ncbi:N-acetyltransferase [Cellulomonas rhizosphaerae]|uniref:N-acetyltransferase n=1 Tax=Cellulomonas rhizosphaerae TaxID=2293719 RepID=A0A413RQH6_9CELL|nr:N-acetyltransferase [Cellulomonas rhizosphaerae]RHA44239.1 N-acetyltransferase [Cellulomonas rhizosphaerae]